MAMLQPFCRARQRHRSQCRGGSPDPWSIAKVSSVFFIFSVCLLGHRGSARRMDVGPSGAVGDIVSGGFEVTATFATELVRVRMRRGRIWWVLGPIEWNCRPTNGCKGVLARPGTGVMEMQGCDWRRGG